MKRPMLPALAALVVLATGVYAQEAPDVVGPAVEAARRANVEGRTDDAVRSLRVIAEEHPHDPRPRPLLAFLLLTEIEDLSGAYEVAEEHLELAARERKDQVDQYVIGLLVSIGDRALDRGDPELARLCMGAVLRGKPLHSKDLRYRWALASYRMGELGPARGAARELIATFPSFSAPYWLLAMSLVDEGRYVEAVEVYRDLLRERSGDIQARMRMGGVLLWNLRDYDGAEKAFKDALAIADPSRPEHAEAQRGLDMVRAERTRSVELRARHAGLGTWILVVLLGWAAVLAVAFFLTRG